MKKLIVKAKKERGAALILFSLMLVTVVLPMMGLAIDGSFIYLAQSRLYSAVDAASLAGGRSLNIGLDLASQKASAETTARNYFYANFPTGTLNSNNVTVTATAAQTTNYTRTVTVKASGSVKLFFMNLLNKPTSLISTTATSTKRDVNLVLVLDRSGSMGDVCDTLIGNAQSFVDKFSNGRDTLGLVTFMGSAKSDYDSTVNFKTNSPTLSAKLGTLACGGGTASADALNVAWQQIQNQNLQGAQPVIVFFTDGNPTVVSSPKVTVVSGVSSGGLTIKRNGSCNGGSPIQGSLAESTTNSDLGVYSSAAVAITDTTNDIVAANNCYYTNSRYGVTYVDRDIDYVPDTDYYGDSTFSTGYSSVTKAAATSDGKQHITVTGPNIEAAATNATDFAANKIRAAGGLIYAIGLGSNGGVDGTLLARIANDPTSASYNATQPSGKYVYSPTAAQLADAFNAIASQILRLSQ